MYTNHSIELLRELEKGNCILPVTFTPEVFQRRTLGKWTDYSINRAAMKYSKTEQNRISMPMYTYNAS